MRIYHPDSPVSRPLPSATAQARFQSITAAYDSLRGKSPHASGAGEPERSRTDFHNLSSAMWRARRQRRAELNIGLDDKWKDRMMLSAIVLVRFPACASPQTGELNVNVMVGRPLLHGSLRRTTRVAKPFPRR